MKKIVIPFVTLFILVSTFTSCKKDSDKANNYLKIDKSAYKLDTLGLYYNGADNNGELYYVDLITPEMIMGNNGYFNGPGNYLELVLITTSSDGVASGEYAFSNKSDDEAPSMSLTNNTLYYRSANTGMKYIYINSGTLTVKRVNSDYVFSFKGTDTEGNTVSAYYEGEGLFYDFSLEKSTAHSGARLRY